ncbi:MAG: hypothetical protein IJ899_09205 [Blautia sp.]|nr:hypothetical protein [Blautia sp.]
MRASTTDDNEAYSDSDARIDPFIYVAILMYRQEEKSSRPQPTRQFSRGGSAIKERKGFKPRR